jgi:hypothetical protein
MRIITNQVNPKTIVIIFSLESTEEIKQWSLTNTNGHPKCLEHVWSTAEMWEAFWISLKCPRDKMSFGTPISVFF